MNNKTKTFISTEYDLKTFSLIGISSIHVAVSFGIIGVSTFIPAQLTLPPYNWNTILIAFLIGIATLFELSRLFIGYLGDNYPLLGSYRRHYVIIGLIFQIIGLLLISQLLGSILIIFGMIFFVIGSSTVSTMSDAYLLDSTTKNQDRGKVAGTIQFFRLLGFAVGGFLGAILYGTLLFERFFILLALFSLILGIIPIYLIKEAPSEVIVIPKGIKSIKREFMSNLNQVMALKVILMSIFLVLFLIGMFAQDAILEPYAIKYFDFNETNIGRLPAIWGTSTLIFIPLAILLEKKIGKVWTITIGIFMAVSALLVISYLGAELNNFIIDLNFIQLFFLINLALFGAGAGLVTTPSTAMMLEVCSSSEARIFLLSFFGLVTTIGRSISSFVAGLILLANYFPLVFLVEAIILLISFFPLIWLDKELSVKSKQ